MGYSCLSQTVILPLVHSKVYNIATESLLSSSDIAVALNERKDLTVPYPIIRKSVSLPEIFNMLLEKC